MGVRRRVKSGVAAIAIAGLIAPGGFAETPPAIQRAPGSTLGVNVAESTDLSRIEFRFAGGAHVTSRRDGQVLTLHFSRYAKPDMRRLRVDPPRFLKTATDRDAGGLEIALTLADGADAKVGEGDGTIFVNLFAAKAPPTAQPAAAPSRPNPAPDSGVVTLSSEVKPGQVLLQVAAGGGGFPPGRGDLDRLRRARPFGSDPSAARLVAGPGAAARAGAGLHRASHPGAARRIGLRRRRGG
jgi:hypothetical protein